MITFTARNLGPLVEGTVELRPLTIFVGPSNTGKSYMASAIYATAMAVGDFSRFRHTGGFSETENTGAAAKSLLEWAKQQARNELSISELPVASLPEKAQEWLKGLVFQQLIFLRSAIVNQIRQLHGNDPGFVRQGSKPSDFQLNIRRQYPVLHLKVQLSDDLEPLPDFDLSQITLPRSAIELTPVFLDADVDEWAEFRIAFPLATYTVQSVFSELLSSIHYMPAARSGIVQGHKVLAAALARQSRRIGLEPISIPSLPGVATEFLGNLIELDKRNANRPKFTNRLGKAIDFIESDVLSGKVDLDESGGLPMSEIVYLPEKGGAVTGKFTLEHTSSMVSELAPLILFLKYRVNPGDLLILEEPESHLHPAAQLRLARGIVRLVNAGVRVLITTHSDTFVSQINNLMRISFASQRWLREKGFSQEECLKPDDLSAYQFDLADDADGTVTKKLEITPDFGVDDDWSYPVVKSLYDETLLVQKVRVS